ncbi:MAG: 2-oxoacid:acceptor oxidoreductase family protein [Syntrophomonadaceae bacterium]|nr:2-oxoacid:acceptor oxidoreductase family protein [Syntrophomonadaceae bacterium]
MLLTRIALAGEGGQGVQSVAEIIAEAAFNEGKQTIYIPNFGIEQRGGVSIAFIQVSDNRIGAPKFDKADVIVALSDRSIARTAVFSDNNTLFVYDSASQVNQDDFPQEAKKIIGIPAIETANNELHPRVFNIIIMGAVLGLSKVVSFTAAKDALIYKLGHKFANDADLKELNFKALEIGRQLGEKALQKEGKTNA